MLLTTAITQRTTWIAWNTRSAGMSFFLPRLAVASRSNNAWYFWLLEHKQGEERHSVTNNRQGQGSWRREESPLTKPFPSFTRTGRTQWHLVKATCGISRVPSFTLLVDASDKPCNRQFRIRPKFQKVFFQLYTSKLTLGRSSKFNQRYNSRTCCLLYSGLVLKT